jgi:hypothetical protein
MGLRFGNSLQGGYDPQELAKQQVSDAPAMQGTNVGRTPPPLQFNAPLDSIENASLGGTSPASPQLPTLTQMLDPQLGSVEPGERAEVYRGNNQLHQLENANQRAQSADPNLPFIQARNDQARALNVAPAVQTVEVGAPGAEQFLHGAVNHKLRGGRLSA